MYVEKMYRSNLTFHEFYSKILLKEQIFSHTNAQCDLSHF